MLGVMIDIYDIGIEKGMPLATYVGGKRKKYLTVFWSRHRGKGDLPWVFY